MGVEVKVISEMATSRNPARVLVYKDGQLIEEVVASVKPERGADGGYYFCVKFEKK